MIQFNALLRKELKEAFRDKRALVAGLFFALLAPAMIFIFSNMLVNKVTDKSDVFIEIKGEQYAPGLVKQLNNNQIFSLPNADEKQVGEWHSRQFVLDIPESYKADMEQGRTVTVTITADMSDQAMLSPMNRITNAINAYSQKIGTQRILMRGIDANLLRPIKVAELDTSKPNNSAVIIYTTLVGYLLFAAFMTGLAVAIDTSAGERERDVLELLLCQPITTKTVVAAKFVSASLISSIGVVLVIVLTSISVSFIDLSQIGASFELGTLSIISMVGLLIPVCGLASVAQLFFAFRAKTFKEANSTLNTLIFIPISIPMAMMFMDTTPAWFSSLPISGHYIILENILKGATVNMSDLIVVTSSTLALIAGLFYSLAESLKSEKTVLALS